MIKKKGKIKWYDSIKGYGFISVNQDKKDVFFHFEEINQYNFGVISPRKGDKVEFEILKNRKGPYASDIELTKNLLKN
ncbi:hypothetical protein NEF87_000253 [Candidatus Lokiarchaeum ossiferum]|uniref:CSD domain-containing protein n=1 Tax=Candidatus Lokiarchaeum ossiferum TaxID=2951803 RepID=A0ABY6HKY4_9ARCH|nr:hypothetical protein NEF87_000253 [Candidatus Lokiarchaeum sp. B-35]